MVGRRRRGRLVRLMYHGATNDAVWLDCGGLFGILWFRLDHVPDHPSVPFNRADRRAAVVQPLPGCADQIAALRARALHLPGLSVRAVLPPRFGLTLRHIGGTMRVNELPPQAA